MNEWYVLYVKSQHERKISAILESNQIKTFVPLYKEVRQWKDRKKQIQLPLFPSYIFVNVTFKKELYTCLSVKNVFTCLKSKSGYSTISNTEIEQIRALTSDSNLTDISTDSEKITVGEKRVITNGPLSGLECIVQNTNNKNRIIVQIKSLYKNITATIPTSYLNYFSMSV